MTGFGSLDWARTHEPAARTAAVVSTLVGGGATCVRRTVVDEFAFGYVPFMSCVSLYIHRLNTDCWAYVDVLAYTCICM